MKSLESIVRCYERRYKRKGKEYKTKQYTINLKKDEVETQGIKCNEEVCIIPKENFQKLIKIHQKYEKIIEEKKQLTRQLNQLQTEHDKLKIEYRHLEEVYKKREKEVSHLQNEVERLQNRGILEIILEKLTKRKAIEEPAKKKEQ
jgi:cell division protein FtsL